MKYERTKLKTDAIFIRSLCEKCQKKFIVIAEVGHADASEPPPGEKGASFGAVSVLQSQPMDYCPRCGHKQGEKEEILPKKSE